MNIANVLWCLKETRTINLTVEQMETKRDTSKTKVELRLQQEQATMMMCAIKCTEYKDSPFAPEEMFKQGPAEFFTLMICGRLMDKMAKFYSTWSPEQISFAMDIVLSLRQEIIGVNSAGVLSAWVAFFNTLKYFLKTDDQLLMLTRFQPCSKRLFDEVLPICLAVREILAPKVIICEDWYKDQHKSSGHYDREKLAYNLYDLKALCNILNEQKETSDLFWSMFQAYDSLYNKGKCITREEFALIISVETEKF